MAAQILNDFSQGSHKSQPSTSLSGQTKSLHPPTSNRSWLARVISISHRLALFAVAIYYVQISLHSFTTAMIVLSGSVSHDLPIQPLKARLILDYAGTSTIRASPLVQRVLNGSTSPLDISIYLESSATQSSTGCSNVPKYKDDIYSNTFLRFIFSRLQMYASYNLSYVTELELVAPVIDCSFDLLTAGDMSTARVYYLVRRKSDTTDVMLLSTSISTQDYAVDEQFQEGPATLLLVAAISDVRAATITHDIAIAYNYPFVAEPEFLYSKLTGVDRNNYWLLQTLANPRNQDPAKNVRTMRRFGRYLRDPTAQSNIEIMHWELPNDPVTELGSWMWKIRAVLHDTWAWAHATHVFFALDVIFNLCVLSFIMYQRMRAGHLWVGDAFSTLSSSLLFRGILVILCNFMNGFWTITKMCIFIGQTYSGLDLIYYRPELIHADMLVFYLCATSLLCFVTRERLDPLFVFAIFEFGWGYRIELFKVFDSSKRIVSAFALADATNGILKASPGFAKLSPMRVMTAYEIVKGRSIVVFVTIMTIFSTIMVIAAYIAVRKVIRHLYSNYIRSSDERKLSAYSTKLPEDELTSFEIATGAALSKRSGIIANYDNYTTWDGRLAATNDAVYSNGFMIVNGKYLLGAQDLLPLIVMKLTRVRFTNIFVYEIKGGTTVRETADLVYPSTISWADIRNIDITRLT